ncbi:MAG: hypothetical protein ISN28_14415 [Ectothiorhodospiraceae bacterium AqS1]|nr:hypothetical protein [Ectothiorhodospiraceae bacterium AqS1]
MAKSGGSQAVITGRDLEAFIEQRLHVCHYKLVKSADFDTLRGLEQPIYAKQHQVDPDIYAKKRRVDFIIYHPDKWPDSLVIEAKWQQSRGSVEEKYPFLVACINESRYESLVILDGDGYTPGAEKWLRGQAGKGRLKNVLNMVELMKFANGGKL